MIVVATKTVGGRIKAILMFVNIVEITTDSRKGKILGKGVGGNKVHGVGSARLLMGVVVENGIRNNAFTAMKNKSAKPTFLPIRPRVFQTVNVGPKLLSETALRNQEAARGVPTIRIRPELPNHVADV